MPVTTSPFRTEQEVQIFRDILPEYERKGGSIDYEGLVKGFNSRVVKLVRQSSKESEQLVNLKTVKHMKEFCDKLKKRICLQKSCAEWLEYLKSVRRAFRVGSFCSWAPAEDKRKAPAPESTAGSSSQRQPLLATLEHADDNGSGKAEKTTTAPPRKSQQKKCTGCGELATRAPRRTPPCCRHIVLAH